MKQRISSEISNFVAELAEQQSQVWEKYRNSLSFVAKLRELEGRSPDVSTLGASAQTFKVLGSGQPPEEIRITVSEIEKEIETVKLLEAEIDGLEKEISKLRSTYIGWGIILLIIGLAIWLWHIGWFVQVLIVIIVLFFLFGKKKR